VAIIVIIKNRLINWEIGIPIAVFGILGAIIGASISVKMDVNNLRKYFGIFLSVIAVFEIYSLIKKYILDKKRHNSIKKNEEGEETI